jgi:hypothetical protein
VNVVVLAVNVSVSFGFWSYSTTCVALYSGYFICYLDVFECADQCVDVWVRIGDFFLQFVVPTLYVICGTGSICVEVVPYLSVTV